MIRRTKGTPALRLVGVVAAGMLALAACGGSSGSGTSAGSGGGDKIAVSLITKDSTNPFFVAMQKGAKKRCVRRGHRHHHRFWQGGRR